MAKYRLSEGNVNEFWDWFGKRKPKTLQQVIDTDPVLKKIDKDMENNAKLAIPYLKRIKKEKPEIWQILISQGLISDKDLN
jgi:hypothetical protein